jgi:hypothetical protein
VRPGAFFIIARRCRKELTVSDQDGGNEGTGDGVFTQEQVDALVAEKLAEVKGENDEAFKNLWNEAKAAKERAKSWDGLDPDEVRTQLDELKELKQSKKAAKAGITGEQLEKLRHEMREDLEKEYSPFKTQAETLAGKVRALQLDNVVKTMMGKNGVRAARVDALFKLTADQFDLTDDGELMLKDSPGKDPEKFIAESLPEMWPEFYEGSGSSGGGASKSAGGAGGRPRTITKGDNDAFIANLEGIADGSVTVVD